MAIKIYEQFAPFANPADGDYPYGSIKNDSIPGAEDGTPLDADWGNDYAGFDAELLAQAGIVPSGQPDKLGASQRVDAIKEIIATTNRFKQRINIGDSTATNSSDPMVNVNRTVGNAGAGNAHCFSDSSTIDRVGGVAYNSYDVRVTVAGTENYDHVAPFQSGMVYETTGSVGIAYGLVDSVTADATTIGTRYGVKINNPNLSHGATIGTNIGYFLEAQTAGSQNWGFYFEGSQPSYTLGKITAAGGLETLGILKVSDFKIDKNPTSGARIEASTGSRYDYALMTQGYTAFIMTVETGTPDVRFWGTFRADGNTTLNGTLAVSGNVGFNGKAAKQPPALPAAATDLASVITLMNSIRTLLINTGLAV